MPSSDHEITTISTARVAILGTLLIALGMLGFYSIPGLMAGDASGSKVINAFYCSVITLTTVGFGDICPGRYPDELGRVFLTVFPLVGLGFFCGPILQLASSWRTQVPGGPLALAAFAITIGVSILTVVENMTISEALHLCIIVGTTVGYGDITPASDLGRLIVAVYAIMVCNAMGGLLDVGREYLESFCRTSPPAMLVSSLTSSSNEKKKSDNKTKKERKGTKSSKRVKEA